jgi:hypothetical protein
MLIYVASCFVVAFLLPATQINPATNRKITAQNYCPPCQLGKLPSSRISTDILALRAQNLQQLGASPDQKSQSRTLCSLLTARQQSTKYHRLTANTTMHRKSLLTANAKSLLTAKDNSSQATQSAASIPVEWCAHPPLPVPYSSLPTHALTPSTTLRPPSFVMS